MSMPGTNVGETGNGGQGTGMNEREPIYDFVYLAGLLDGEGCITYKQYWDRKRKDRPRKYLCWRIQMEIVMTHKPTVQWCCDNFGGNVVLKPRKEYKMQYRWRRCFRDAFKIAKDIVPFAKTKKEKLQQIINHYDKQKTDSSTKTND